MLFIVETQTPITNVNGLVSLEIGTGTVVSGDFTTIDWANGTYFIKTETDVNGGANYTITGTTQLMSVPYALHAKTAESITGTVNYTETDPVFGASVTNGITTIDTANWNNHTVDTDTHIDSVGIDALGFVAGAHTVDTDTHIDSTGITSLGFVTGPHTPQLNEAQVDAFVANNGYLITEVDGSITNEIQTLSVNANNLTISGTGGNTIALPMDSSWTTSGNDIYRMGIGNVGINTTTPSQKLDINGSIKITDGSEAAGKVLTSDSTGVASWATPVTSDGTGGLVSQNGEVRRDFITFNTTINGSSPIHIKTNIPEFSNIMYRILVEGYAYGSSGVINSDVCGYVYSTIPGISNSSTNNYANGVTIYSLQIGTRKIWFNNLKIVY